MDASDGRFDPSEKVLRQFAALWIPAFAALGLWQGFAHGRPVLGWVLLALALTLGPAGLLHPAVLRPIFVGWMWLTFPLSWAVTHVILGVLFFGVFTPLGLLFRLMGRDVLVRRRAEGYSSYWKARPRARDLRAYLRQS